MNRKQKEILYTIAMLSLILFVWLTANYIDFIVNSRFPPSTGLERKIFLETTLAYIFFAAFYFAVGMGLFYLTYTAKANEPIKPS